MSSPFSSRVTDVPPENRLSSAIASARKEGRPIIDLTASNPTRVGLDYPAAAIADALAAGARFPYEAAPLGIPSARTAIAERIGAADEDIVVTVSTSEAYSFLFKLLADPGGEILTARPAYPLLEHLAAIESCRLRHFALAYDRGRGWSIEIESVVECLTDATRAIVVVHPANPIGSFVAPEEAHALGVLCAERNIALVSDEVFLPYPLESDEPPPSLGTLDLPCLTFSLGGLSKQGGMPHLKLGWIHVSGPESLRRQALDGLELVSDNFLSVSTPVQAAVGDLLAIADDVRDLISDRTRSNLSHLLRAITDHPHVECLTPRGGWSAVLRIPSVMPDEDLAIRILEKAGVIVFPGHFFDFEREGYLVVSLLARDFGKGVALMLEEIAAVLA